MNYYAYPIGKQMYFNIPKEETQLFVIDRKNKIVKNKHSKIKIKEGYSLIAIYEDGLVFKNRIKKIGSNIIKSRKNYYQPKEAKRFLARVNYKGSSRHEYCKCGREMGKVYNVPSIKTGDGVKK